MDAPLDPAAAAAADSVRALVDSAALVERLHATCCEPGRSPRMERLTETLTVLGGSLAEGGPVDDTMSALADAGAQVGWLQVACCSEKRMPLYEEVQQHLARVYRALQQHGH